MSFLSVLLEYKLVIVFYLIIIAVIYFNRKKFDFQAKFIALYRTKIGIKLMHSIADTFGPVIRGCGYAGIFVGYAGMALIVYFLFNGLYNIFFVPEAPATIAPVIPGVPIPGSPIFVPFWYGIISLFVVVLVHEFSHGVVAVAHKIKVKHSGIVFFGPLIGAFVEPDEKELKKKNWWKQQSMFAAGPVSNAVLSLIVMLILLFALFPFMASLANPTGFYFHGVSEGYPAIEAGVKAGVVYTMVNNVTVNNATYLNNVLSEAKPGDTLVIGNENTTHTMVLVESPEKKGRAFMGILGLQSNYELKDPNDRGLLDFLTIIGKFLEWVFVLSLGIGLANLLPLGPVDGGRMLSLSFKKIMPEKKAMVLFTKITYFMLLLILFLVFVPIIRAVFFG